MKIRTSVLQYLSQLVVVCPYDETNYLVVRLDEDLSVVTDG